MKGFKSYGKKKVSLPLSEGFTCVIGPNGSGKSNIADALLFVLGGLSAKAMRAEVFSDLIYAGDNTNQAKVSLYFDNEDEKFPIEKKEVVIAREVSDDGTSTYRVNGKRETRRYVLDLLLEAGVTPDGYNIVHQGEIMDFINITPVERRNIIEEISGIAEFDEKKERGLRELEEAEENLARVHLVMDEVKKQMDRLEKEKNDAIRYNHLKSKIREHMGILVHSKLEKNKKELKKKKEKIRECKEKIEEKKSALQSYIDSINTLETKLKELEEELDRKNAEYIETNKKSEKLKRELLKLEQKIAHEKENLEKNRSETEELKREKTQLQNEIEQIEEDITNLDEKKRSLKEKIESHRKEINELEKKIQEDTDFLKKDHDTLVKKLEKKREEFYEKKNELESLKNKKEYLEETIKKNRDEYQKKKSRRASIRTQIDEHQSALHEIDERVTLYKSEVKKIENKINKLDKELWNKKEELLKIKSSIKARKSLDKRKDKPYKKLKTSGIQGIYGRIKNLGTVNTQYSTALEVAAGRRLDYIVVDTADTAKECVQYLKKERVGRATFIPLDKIRSGRLRDVEKREGFVDYAINLVEFDEILSPAFEYVFGDTIVIKNMDCAKNFESFRRVTLDGELIERTNVVTGGFYRPRGGFEEKEETKKLEQLQGRIEEIKSEKNSLEKDLVTVKKKLKEQERKKTEIRTEIKTLTSAIEENVQGVEIKKLKERIEEDERKLKEIESELSLFREEYSDRKQLLEDMEQKKDALYAKLMERSGEELERLDALKKEREDLRSQYQELDKQYASKKSRLDVLTTDHAKTSKKITENEEYSKKMAQTVEQYEASLKTAQERIDEVEKSMERKKEELEDVKKRRSTANEEISTARKEKEAREKTITNLHTRISLLEQRTRDLKEKIEEISAQADAYEKTEIREDIEELSFKIQRMRREKEGLEPINMRAIEEFEETEERYLTLKTKYKKIQKEKEAVLEFIGKIERRKKEVFMETFNEVADNFSEIFLELSGGEGDLLLEDKEDPFDGGVEIEARPQGKEMKTTAAMSGGEKALTALAFIFAIQRYKTAPFYLFDEIDAHLDDENVKKVAEMIKRASENSQFIVITLRDAMMSSADRLFGVSMRDNISRIVAVELQETQQFTGKKFEVVEEA